MKKVYCDVCGKDTTEEVGKPWLKVIIKLISATKNGPWAHISTNKDICEICALRISKFIDFLAKYPNKVILVEGLVTKRSAIIHRNKHQTFI